MLKKLTWDSDFFNLKVGVIRGISEKSVVYDHISLAKSRNFELVYLFLPPGETDKTLLAELERTYLLADHRIIYHKNNLREPEPVPEIFPLDNQNFGTVSHEIYELAIESGSYSRFKSDPGIPDSTFRELYKLRIDNILNGRVPGRILACSGKERLCGFVSVELVEPESRIGLIAIRQQHRGRGMGAALLGAAEHEVWTRNGGGLAVATQKANTGACRFYERCGYDIKKEQLIFHLWLK